MSKDGLGVEVTGALGYLLKHAHLKLDALASAELQPLGIAPRELGVMRVLASREPTSQQDVARMLDVDRTTMVALIDGLEAKGVVSRTPSREDRRRNLVTLTRAGSKLLTTAEAASRRADRQLLTPLTASAAEQLRATLHHVVAGDRR